MTRWTTWAVCAAMLLLWTAGAPAALPRCENAHRDSRCSWRHRGAEPEEAIRARGEEVIRFSGGYALRSAEAFMIELRHARSGEYLLSVRNAMSASAINVGPITAADWRRFVALRAKFAADNAALDPVLDAIPLMAYPLLPGCAALGEWRVLCPQLGGDRAAAGRFAGPINTFNQQFCDAEAHKPALRAAYRIGTANDGSGGAVVSEADVRQVLCIGSYSYFQASRYAGAEGMIVVTGLALRNGIETLPSGMSHGVEWVAPFRQLWRVDGEAISLEDCSVGNFAKTIY